MQKYKGLIIAIVITLSWAGFLAFLLPREPDFTSTLTYLFILIQTHLYTGLFITAHDAMHGVVVPGNKKANTIIGTVTAGLFAYNFYHRLYPKHHQHHQHVATENDPDFHPPHSENFFVWYFSFLKQYITIWQIVMMGITYQFLLLFFSQSSVVTWWIVPAIISTFQLFFFGTYLPHKGEHENKHYSRSFRNNHLLAFLSCYFFGYHYEHHDKPYLPWWKLYKAKDNPEYKGV